MKASAVAFIMIFIALCGCSRKEEKPLTAVELAIRMVSKPPGLLEGDAWGLQAYRRLSTLEKNMTAFRYRFRESDRPAWNALLKDNRASVYARLCAAYFLMDNDEEARQFVREQLKSANLRHRYNAAKILEWYRWHDSSATWAVDLLIEQLANGSLDRSSVTQSPPGEFPEGDRDDIIYGPDEICNSLRLWKEKKAVPAMISLLKRRQCIEDAAHALGDFGETAAAPVILEAFKTEHLVNPHQVVKALGMLKYKPAVPTLVSMLLDRSNPNADYTKEGILEALSEIGDLSAVDGIQKYLQSDIPHGYMRTAARRVLIQMQDTDPVPGLLGLFDSEPYEPERGELVRDLAKHKDGRVIKKLSQIARESESAFMRREAILGLREIVNREALAELSSLLEVEFPKKLKAEWGWKGPPEDFAKFFQDLLIMCLKQKTNQDFGSDAAKWKAWIEENVRD